MEENINDSVDSIDSVDSTLLSGRVYELAVLFVPTIDETQVFSLFGDLKNMLETKEVSFVSEDTPKKFELAYEMSRTIQNKKTWFSEAYFSWIKFEADASTVKVINDTLLRDESIIRFMIIKTVKENTIFSKKPFYKTRKEDGKSEHSSESERVEETKQPLSEQEVDKEIDAMLEA